jgi:hypothetical protein
MLPGNELKGEILSGYSVGYVYFALVTLRCIQRLVLYPLQRY